MMPSDDDINWKGATESGQGSNPKKRSRVEQTGNPSISTSSSNDTKRQDEDSEASRKRPRSIGSIPEQKQDDLSSIVSRNQDLLARRKCACITTSSLLHDSAFSNHVWFPGLQTITWTQVLNRPLKAVVI